MAKLGEIKFTKKLKHYDEIMKLQERIEYLCITKGFFNLLLEEVNEVDNLLEQRRKLLWDKEGQYIYK